MKTRNMLCVMLMSAVFSNSYAADSIPPAEKGKVYYKRTVKYIDNAGITAKVKSELFKDPLLSGFNINVETKNGKVHLSGITNTVLQFNRAITTAAKQKGVKLVIADDLRVRDAVTPHADMTISALAMNELEMYNDIHPDNPLDLNNIEAEVHNKKIYVHGLAKSNQQKRIIIAILRSIDGNKGVYSALRSKNS